MVISRVVVIEKWRLIWYMKDAKVRAKARILIKTCGEGRKNKRQRRRTSSKNASLLFLFATDTYFSKFFA